MFLKTFEAVSVPFSELHELDVLPWNKQQIDSTYNQSEQRNTPGTVTPFCDWLGCVKAAGNRFEWEGDQTHFSRKIKHTAQKFRLVSRQVSKVKKDTLSILCSLQLQ